MDSVSSTNSECIKRALAGDKGFLWIVASRQTGGRGRRNKAWFSEPGNVYASLLLINSGSSSFLLSLPFIISLAVQETIKSVMSLGDSRVEVKWPNDVLIRQRKVAGILIESVNLLNRSQAIVIGIGINVSCFPETVVYPVTSLKAEGASVELEDVYVHLFQKVEKMLSMWDQGRGRNKIMNLWRNAVYGIGEIITVNLPDRSLRGRFVDIDDNGFLLLEIDNGDFVQISTGDVFLKQDER
nr:biotin--[acetyl-CoA-carboxylase] ligase [Liberibacter crescens]